jgi:hypothetical protein
VHGVMCMHGRSLSSFDLLFLVPTAHLAEISETIPYDLIFFMAVRLYIFMTCRVLADYPANLRLHP